MLVRIYFFEASIIVIHFDAIPSIPYQDLGALELGSEPSPRQQLIKTKRQAPEKQREQREALSINSRFVRAIINEF